MTPGELKLLDEFLERLAVQMSAAGCNDFEMSATPGNLDLYAAAYNRIPWVREGKVFCDDFVILEELRRRLRA